jgi:hypothetical protein
LGSKGFHVATISIVKVVASEDVIQLSHALSQKGRSQKIERVRMRFQNMNMIHGRGSLVNYGLRPRCSTGMAAFQGGIELEEKVARKIEGS